MSGCDGDRTIASAAAAPEAAPDVASAPAPAAETAGPAVELAALPAGRLQEAAAVMQIHPMPRQNAKVFGVGGGDPAANGLMTYLGLFEGAAEGWRLYQIGDFESWRVSEEGEGRIVLDVSQSRADDSGGIVTESRRLIVTFQAEPNRVTVTPAR